ncbi:MAG: GTP-binding protein, partial [Bacteroidales bacterium]|nr:GTP-binding protein [Bacteroidales bacterium]
EYGISTFVYYRRRPFDINKFDRFVTKQWDRNIIRSKGLCWFTDDYDMSYMFEQAGVQKKLQQSGSWYATAPAEDLVKLMEEDENLMKDWDPMVGDRMQKIVFIGQNMDKEQIIKDLDFCLD